ncbi:hypothetical protein DL765_010598 [Monosporascus sp. GIB2]|nr:hypothetical protein DL765_010598 [Monosporascus sp. GIB2]
MRLLRLEDDGEYSLIEFVGHNIPRYAILSHTWGADDEELTFKDLVGGTGKNKAGYRKIRFCGKQAAHDGLQFFWVDTCCIDKSSSAELSEAINSMFRWYHNAAKCYVYLSDVSVGGSVESDPSSQRTWKPDFQRSRWFTRGWTLQELLAPISVEFFSVEGERLGDRISLLQEIHDTTGISIQALQGCSLSQFSVEERMSWAERRKTKREEDATYSLLGIFDVHMPLIYGEGPKKAFVRLQKEIEIVKLTKGAEYDLPTVASALYNSVDDQHVPLCAQGTRISILSQITAWVNDVDGETIFWVYGPAGIGKSTISRTLAHSLANTGQLGASYFFKRGEEGRNGTARFFPTIASQLITTIPTFKNFLRKSLEKLGNAKVEEKALGEQFKILFLAPLSEMVPETSGILTRVIVIDALDECEHSGDIPLICSLLSQLQELITVHLRVFLTSRSAHPVVGAFEDLKNNDTTYRGLALHEEFYADTKADICTFLQARFASIKVKQKITKDPWPDPKDFDRLLTLATNPSPLFIYAATLCRFVYDETGRKNPTHQLKLWLKDCDSNAPQLDQIYMPILNQVLFGSYEEGKSVDPLSNEDQSQVLQILGAIVLLATPLPAQSLAFLLDMNESDVNHWLRNFHAVLNVPSDHKTPVEVLHKSFSDFLLGREGTGTDNVRVSAAETHAMLVSKCIQRMKSRNGLRKDVCNLQEPGKSRDEIDKAIVAGHIPPDLEYACLYWVYHLQHSGRRITDGDEICDFLNAHFLHWVESLSLLRRLSDGILSIRELLKTVQTLEGHGGSVNSIAFSSDGKMLASVSYDETVRLWDAATGAHKQTLEGHRGCVNSVAFSPDAFSPNGKIIGSASDDRTVRLWDATTGAHTRTLDGHSNYISAVTFSPDGKLLATVSGDKTIRLWDAGIGTHIRTLDGHRGYIRAVAFSPDGKIFASASGDKTVRLWDASIGTHKQTLDSHGDKTVWVQNVGIGTYKETFDIHSCWVRAVAFSPDGKVLASASGDRTIRLWDATTGAHKRTLDGHSDWVISVAFSPDGKMLTSASSDGTVRLWDATTGAYKQTLNGHRGWVNSVVFSPDNKMLTSASGDKTVRLWDASTGAHIQTLDGHSDWVNSVAFSPNGKMLASASDDKTVRLWDTSTGAHIQTLDGHGGRARAVAFSPDGKMLASASGDKTVRLWDAGTGAHIQTMVGHRGYVRGVAFSPDGNILASVSGDGTVRLWDAATGAHIQILDGHGDWVNSVAFSPDGRILASASDDRTNRIILTGWQNARVNIGR